MSCQGAGGCAKSLAPGCVITICLCPLNYSSAAPLMNSWLLRGLRLLGPPGRPRVGAEGMAEGTKRGKSLFPGSSCAPYQPRASLSPRRLQQLAGDEAAWVQLPASPTPPAPGCFHLLGGGRRGHRRGHRWDHPTPTDALSLAVVLPSRGGYPAPCPLPGATAATEPSAGQGPSVGAEPSRPHGGTDPPQASSHTSCHAHCSTLAAASQAPWMSLAVINQGASIVPRQTLAPSAAVPPFPPLPLPHGAQ